MRAAIPKMALTVTTPVPPMPAIWMSAVPVGVKTGSGRGACELESIWPVRLSRAPVTVTKEGQKTFDTREVLIATGLIDPALAPELGLQGLDGEAVGFARAVAAPFADGGVDEKALVRLGVRVDFAAAPHLCGANL